MLRTVAMEFLKDMQVYSHAEMMCHGKREMEKYRQKRKNGKA